MLIALIFILSDSTENDNTISLSKIDNQSKYTGKR